MIMSFAFNSLCVSFSFLLAFQLADRRNRQLHVFFSFWPPPRVLVITIWKNILCQKILLYYLGNSLPQIILLVLLGLFIWKSKAT